MVWRKQAKVYRTRHVKADRRHQKVANRAVLTVAAICTATLARADTFAERWPAPSAVDPVRVAQAPQPNRLRRSGRRLPAIAFISPRTSIGIGHASDETSVRAVHHCSRKSSDPRYIEDGVHGQQHHRRYHRDRQTPQGDHGRDNEGESRED